MSNLIKGMCDAYDRSPHTSDSGHHRQRRMSAARDVVLDEVYDALMELPYMVEDGVGGQNWLVRRASIVFELDRLREEE